ncbi:MAG: dTDP-4-amino-4,6-dideoxygalactose transaminase, partial [Caulobacteraceae bacterium]|nr:dTDP-4-amino-4,6-dideoxygalactose transaminase [Caulobacteraceae bacterium]
MAATPPILIPFVEPLRTGAELEALRDAVGRRRLAGDNVAARAAETYLRDSVGVAHALLTPSGTAALELAALLIGLAPGDEVIMPSFTFSSTANAVVLRGATPVFVDVRADTLNIDASLIRPALTERTRAIVVVHYAGVPCDMDPIVALAKEHGLIVIEDAAQALHARYRGRAAGALADMAAFSFHETKNIHCGEGGAFTCHSPEWGRRAEIVREKGTNRAAFFRGEIDKYTWIDVGSSFLPSELNAAFLGVQLERSLSVTARRLALWTEYDAALSSVQAAGKALTPQIPGGCEHNAHIYHLRLPSLEARTAFIGSLRDAGIQATSHYVPLHSSPAGQRYGRWVGSMANTDAAG